MTKVQEIEQAIALLPTADYARLRKWFLQRDEDQWDQELAADTKAGKLDFLLQEAAEAKAKGKLRPL